VEREFRGVAGLGFARRLSRFHGGIFKLFRFATVP
jgi:hypothetical protein